MLPADLPRLPRPLFAALLCLALGGCADSLSRSDFLTEHTGDAVAANKAIHIANPWRRDSFDTSIPADGMRSAATVNRYRAGADAPAAAAPARPAGAGTQ